MINDKLTKELQEQIAENEEEITKIKNGEVYSTNEVKTNKTWIDGKPIYKKVFNTNIDTSTVGWKEVGTLEFDEIVNSSFICTTTNEPTRIRTNNTYCNLSFYNNKCYIAGTGAWDSTENKLMLKKIIVEYTKQTN